MIFRRKKISSLKIDIWNRIHALQNKVDASSKIANQNINVLYGSFNSFTEKDPEIKNTHKSVVRLLQVSKELLDFINENIEKDKDFECLSTIVDLLTSALWQLSYIEKGQFDIKEIDSVCNFFKANKNVFISLVDNIATSSNYLSKIEIIYIANECKENKEIDSLKYRNNQIRKVIESQKSLINSKLEANLSSKLRGSINVEEAIANFEYSDQIEKENKEAFEKIEKAENRHYQYVRSLDTEAIINIVTARLAEDDVEENSKEIVATEKVVASIKDEGTLLSRIKRLLDNDYKDFVGAWANIRFSIDCYMKYFAGIDFNISKFNCGVETLHINEQEIKNSSKDIFIALFGREDGEIIDQLWGNASEMIHGGKKFKYLVEDKEVQDLLAGAENLDRILGKAATEVDFVEGTKKLYQRYYPILKEGCDNIETIKEISKLISLQKNVNSFERFLREKEIESSFFDNYPKIPKVKKEIEESNI